MRKLRFVIVTNNNLFSCGVITYEACLCTVGCGFDETSDHVFLHCNIFGAIILSNLPLLVVFQGCVNPFYRFFGSQHRGKYGKKETIDSSMANNVQFYRWWIKLSRCPLCG